MPRLLSRHSPDTGDFAVNIALLTGCCNGKSLSPGQMAIEASS